MADARQSAAAGVFYPAQRDELTRVIEEMLSAARPPTKSTGLPGAPRAIVVPHGPYDLAGPVAAAAWARVVPLAARIERVVLLGPAHHSPFRGVAAPFADAFETPLGAARVDRIAIETIRRVRGLVISDAPHDQEYSVEAQVPFVQSVLATALIVPLIVGEASQAAAAAVLDLLWDDKTLVVVSTDLSRYHEAVKARALDEATARAIESLDVDAIGDDQVCGPDALRGLLHVSRGSGLRATRLELRQCGEPEEVVGFGAFMMSENPTSIRSTRAGR